MKELDPMGDFKPLTEEMSGSPIVGAGAVVVPYLAPIDGLRLTTQIVGILYEAVMFFRLYGSNYYYYGYMKSFSRCVTLFWVMMDSVGQLNLISPTPTWNRYRTN